MLPLFLMHGWHISSTKNYLNKEDMTMADWTPESRSEEILFATINGEEYNGLPESRIEELLLELKEVIEAGGGGGGGGTTNYNLLQNKPKVNGHTLQGNLSTDDLEIEQPLTTEQLNALLALIPD